MEALKILERAETIQWDYDREADVLYLSIGEPCDAVGMDVGDGLIARYDESTRRSWDSPWSGCEAGYKSS